MLVEQADADVVGHDQAVEAPLLPKHLGQQVARGVAGLVVEVVVRRHHRSRAGLLHAHLEREQEHVVELAPAEVHRPVVARALAPGVARVVLERREQVALLALQAAHEAGAEHTHQVRVFAQRLLGPAPAHVARDVEHRRQPLVAPDAARLAPDRLRRTLDEVRVPGGAVGERRGEQRRAARHQADQALLVRDRGDPEPSLLAQELLQPVERAHAGARVDAVAAERARDLAQAVAEGLLHDRGVRAACEVVLARPVLAVLGQDQPQRVHLRGLLLERHPRDEVVHPLRDGAGAVLVRKGHGVVSVWLAERRHILTAVRLVAASPAARASGTAIGVCSGSPSRPASLERTPHEDRGLVRRLPPARARPAARRGSALGRALRSRSADLRDPEGARTSTTSRPTARPTPPGRRSPSPRRSRRRSSAS